MMKIDGINNKIGKDMAKRVCRLARVFLHWHHQLLIIANTDSF